MDILRSNILPQIQEYNLSIEKYFFPIRNFFKFYNKKVTVQITAEERNLVYTKESTKSILEINPIIPGVRFSLTSLMISSDFYMLTMVPPFTKGSNILFFHKNKIFHEVLEIFFTIANNEDKDLLIKKILTLLGYNISNSTKNIFIIKNRENALNNNIKQDFLEEYVYINYEPLNKTTVNKVIKTINSKKKYTYKYLISVTNLFSSEIEEIEANGISYISIQKILHILIKYNLFEYIINFIQDAILKNKESEIISKLKLKKDGDILIEKLIKTPKGHKMFKEFENIVNEIFKYLLQDSFRQYFAEENSREEDGHQIRDLVISNISPIEDFWKERKQEQKAKRIIIDSKNYSKNISKGSISDISQYLNEKMGKFAIIVSREEIDNSGKKEQKIRYKDKDELIIHLSQDDLISMIHHKINNKKIEDILEKKIHEIIK